MIELLLVLALYSVAVLLLAPLEKIGKWQTAVRKWAQKLLDKANK